MPKENKIPSQDLYELKLIEHVENTPRLSNRQASRILGVSLKLAHDILTRMVKKGCFHVQKHHARRWDYFLTPKGIAEKARLTMEFLDFSMSFYRQARRLSAQLCRDLSEAGIKQVAFLGADDLAEITYLGVQEWGLELTAVYDIERQGERFLNQTVKPGNEVANDRSEAIVICLYDASMPMRLRYLPPGIPELPTMHWIFDQQRRPAEEEA